MPDQSTLLSWALGLNGLLISVLIGIVVRNNGKVDRRFDGIDTKSADWLKEIEGKLKDFYLVVEKRFEGIILSFEKKHDSATTAIAVTNKDIEQIRRDIILLRAEQDRIREHVHDLGKEPNVASLVEYLERRKQSGSG